MRIIDGKSCMKLWGMLETGKMSFPNFPQFFWCSFEHMLHAGLNATLASNIRSCVSCWKKFSDGFSSSSFVSSLSRGSCSCESYESTAKSPKCYERDLRKIQKKSYVCVFVVSASVMHSVRAWKCNQIAVFTLNKSSVTTACRFNCIYSSAQTTLESEQCC